MFNLFTGTTSPRTLILIPGGVCVSGEFVFSGVPNSGVAGVTLPELIIGGNLPGQTAGVTVSGLKLLELDKLLGSS